MRVSQHIPSGVDDDAEGAEGPVRLLGDHPQPVRERGGEGLWALRSEGTGLGGHVVTEERARENVGVT